MHFDKLVKICGNEFCAEITEKDNIQTVGLMIFLIVGTYASIMLIGKLLKKYF